MRPLAIVLLAGCVRGPPADPLPAPNALAASASPYLRAHARDPVPWREWSDAAFAEARRRDVPVFVSVGYLTCHGCALMAEETFSDPDVGRALGESFVPVLVDRQERPDVDRAMGDALQELIGRSGWPANVFLTPDGHPFLGGTYWPPDPGGLRPSFGEVLQDAFAAWGGDRAAVVVRADGLGRRLAARGRRAGGTEVPAADAVGRAVSDLALHRDRTHGGWGEAKFPRPPILELLLDRVAVGDPVATEPLVEALDAMIAGRIHDRVHGGFFRCTVDPAWQQPHTEKLLHDNAQLAAVYLDAWRVLGVPRYRAIGLDTLRWTLEALWSEEAGAFAAGLAADDRYYASGGRRPAPARDDLVVVAWNGLALTALARGHLVEPEDGRLDRARRLAEVLLAARDDRGLMPRTLGGAPGVLEDTVLVAEGLLDLHEADPDPRWLGGALDLVRALDAFRSSEGGWWSTPDPDSRLARSIRAEEADEPSGYGRATLLHARLATLGASGVDAAATDRALARLGASLDRDGAGFALPSLVRALDLRHRRGTAMVVAGDGEAARALVAAWTSTRRPGGVLAVLSDGADVDLPRFADRTAGPDEAVAWVCTGGECLPPTDDPAVLARALRRMAPFP